jgi:hypothetical protein
MSRSRSPFPPLNKAELEVLGLLGPVPVVEFYRRRMLTTPGCSAMSVADCEWAVAHAAQTRDIIEGLESQLMTPRVSREVLVETRLTQTITAADIRKAFRLPKNAEITFAIPGGGDWSNTTVDIDAFDLPLTARWTEKETKTNG